MCWSAAGRPRPAVVRTMRYAAAAAARQKPAFDPAGFAQRWSSDVGTAIQSRHEDWLISGDRQALAARHRDQEQEYGELAEASPVPPFEDDPPEEVKHLQQEESSGLTTPMQEDATDPGDVVMDKADNQCAEEALTHQQGAQPARSPQLATDLIQQPQAFRSAPQGSGKGKEEESGSGAATGAAAAAAASQGISRNSSRAMQ